MIGIDLNEQFITYVIYKGCGKWYISDKEIWYLDYQKRIEEYYGKGGFDPIENQYGYEYNVENTTYYDENGKIIKTKP